MLPQAGELPPGMLPFHNDGHGAGSEAEEGEQGGSGTRGSRGAGKGRGKGGRKAGGGGGGLAAEGLAGVAFPLKLNKSVTGACRALWSA